MTQPIISESNSLSKRSPHMRFLDGLRGLSALYVVLFHLYGNNSVPFSALWIQLVTAWMHYGGYAVDVFIVLSGYCLMIPVARSNGELRGGFIEYIKRRARRILPPYYAALLIASILLMIIPAASNNPDYLKSIYNLDIANLLSHLFLVHNIKAQWARSIDPPMWSVATEWQIYFLFPTILLPVWRRFGNRAVIVIGFLIGMLPIWLSQGRWFWWASPWFIGLFAMGMVGATIQFHNTLKMSLWRKNMPWGWLSMCCFFFVCLLLISIPSQIEQFPYLMDALVALTTLTFIAYCARISLDKTKTSSIALRILESPLALKLGAFSYSLYLVHNIVIIHLCDSFSIFLSSITPLTSLSGFLVDSAFKIFTTIGFSYLFHILFEKPFMVRNS